MEKIAKPGVPCSHLYHLSSQVVKKRGLEDHFIGTKKNQASFVGHGIGLEIDEFPLLAKGFSQPLEIGMVFAFEPKFIFPDVGVVALEDDYVVTEQWRGKADPCGRQDHRHRRILIPHPLKLLLFLTVTRIFLQSPD